MLRPLPRAGSLPVRCTPGVDQKNQDGLGPLLVRAGSLPNPRHTVPDLTKPAETLSKAETSSEPKSVLQFEQEQLTDGVLSLQGLQSGHIKVAHASNVVSMPRTPVDLSMTRPLTVAPLSHKARLLIPLPRAVSLPVRCTPVVDQKHHDKLGPLLGRADSLPNPLYIVPDLTEAAGKLSEVEASSQPVIEQAQSIDAALSQVFEQGLQSGHIKVAHDSLRASNVASIPRTPADVEAPASQQARQQFIPLPTRTASPPSRVPTTNQGPSASNQESRFSTIGSSAQSTSFLGKYVLRVMARLHWRWRTPTATPLLQSEHIPEGPTQDPDQRRLRPRRADGMSIETQTSKANRSMRDILQKRQRGHQNRKVGMYQN